MRKLALICVLMLSGCMTSEAIYEDLELIRDNVEIQAELSKFLLEKVVIPKSPKQVEAIAVQKVEVEERYEYIVHAVNRVILYLRAEMYVDLLIHVTDYVNAGNTKEMLEKVKERIHE